MTTFSFPRSATVARPGPQQDRADPGRLIARVLRPSAEPGTVAAVSVIGS